MGLNFVVVIATSTRPELLDRTLTSLASCRKPGSYRETIVVENGKTAAAEAVAKRFQSSLHLRYLREDEANKSRALNAAVATLGDSFVFFTDDDVRFDPDVLCMYETAALSSGEGHFFGGPVGVDYETEPPQWLQEFMPASARGWSLDGGQQNIGEAMFLGFNWAAFACDLRKAGAFNTDFGPGSDSGSVGQETEMQSRLLKLGIQGMYLPGARVWHYVPAERCTKQWISHRGFRVGIRDGLIECDLNWRCLWGYPRWTLRELFRKSLAFLKQTVVGDEKSRFRSRQDLNFIRGYMRGARLAHQRPTRGGRLP